MCQLKKQYGIALHGTDNTGVYHAVVDGKNNYSIIQAPSLVALNQNAVDAYTHGKFVKTYYEDHFQRHSIDDRGMPILSVVDEQHPDAYDNAFGMEKQCVMVKQVHQQEKRMLPF